MKKSFALFLMLLTVKLYAAELEQKKWYPGYYLNLQKDTITGFIQHRKKASSTIASFKYSNYSKKILRSGEIYGYGYADKAFESQPILLQNCFLERYIDGEITLYKKGNSYFIKKGNRDAVKINKIIAKSILLEYIEDNTKQYELVKSLDNFSFKMIVYVVNDYNIWAIKNKQEELVTPRLSTSAKFDSTSVDEKEPTPPKQITINEMPKQRAITPRINLFGIGLGLESKITKTSSLYLEGGSGFYLFGTTDGDGGFYLLPYFKAHYRIYVNLKQRHKARKKIKGWNGDYVSPVFIYTADNKRLETENLESVFYGLNYGIQRQKGTSFYWGIEVGAGVRTQLYNNLTTMGYLFKINLGFAL